MATYKIINTKTNKTLVTNLTVNETIDFICKATEEPSYKSGTLRIEPYTRTEATINIVPVSYCFVGYVEIDNRIKEAVNVNGGYYFIDCEYHDWSGTTVRELYNSTESLTIYNDWDGDGWYIITRDIHRIYC